MCRVLGYLEAHGTSALLMPGLVSLLRGFLNDLIQGRPTVSSCSVPSASKYSIDRGRIDINNFGNDRSLNMYTNMYQYTYTCVHT